MESGRKGGTEAAPTQVRCEQCQQSRHSKCHRIVNDYIDWGGPTKCNCSFCYTEPEVPHYRQYKQRYKGRWVPDAD